jgi:hypothetical protein
VAGELQALYAINIDGSHLRKIVPYRYEVAIKHDWAPTAATSSSLSTPTTPTVAPPTWRLSDPTAPICGC